MSTFRITFPALYDFNADITARQGHYVEAETAEKAIQALLKRLDNCCDSRARQYVVDVQTSAQSRAYTRYNVVDGLVLDKIG